MRTASNVRTAIFRADASTAIGTGHLYRCKYLAFVLKKRGYRTIFICRNHINSLHEIILGNEYEFYNLAPSVYSSEVLPESSYSDWLGCTQSQDAHDFISVIDGLDALIPSLIVVDHYGLDSKWELEIRSVFPETSLLVLDDLANRAHFADYLLDSGRVACWSDKSYSSLLNKDCTSLLGPRYSLLSSDYLELRNTVLVRDSLRKILVFFGGVDLENWCLFALQALLDAKLSHLNVDVVVGRSSPHLPCIEEIVLGHPNWQLHVGLPSLAPLIATSDLAIGAGGVHSWERACLGLPALTIAIAENQKTVLNQLDSVGAVRFLTIRQDDSGMNTLVKQLVELNRNPLPLQLMSESAFFVVDCQGVNRILTALCGPSSPFSLRPACFSDLGLYFWWANDPTVRQSSLSEDEIDFPTHYQWFLKCLSSSDVLLRVMTDASGLPIGQIRFQRDSENNGIAIVSLSLDQLARGKGLGFELLTQGMHEMNRVWGASIKTLAYVKATNHASSKLFSRFGFSEISPRDSGVKCLSYGPSI